jgi:hypothetical protein
VVLKGLVNESRNEKEENMRRLGIILAAGSLLTLAATATVAASTPTLTVTEVDRTRVLAASPTTCSLTSSSTPRASDKTSCSLMGPTSSWFTST